MIASYSYGANISGASVDRAASGLLQAVIEMAILAAYIVPEIVLSIPVLLIAGIVFFVVLFNSRFECCGFLKTKYYHQIIRRLLHLEKGPDDTDDDPQTLLYRYVIPKKGVILFTLSTTIIMAMITLIFLDILLIERGYSCRIGADCFVMTSNGDYWSSLYDEPIDNCTIAEEVMSNNASNFTELICYKYGFQFASAAGIAGGLLTIFSLITHAMSFVFLELKEKGGYYSVAAWGFALLCHLASVVAFLLLFAIPELREFFFMDPVAALIQINVVTIVVSFNVAILMLVKFPVAK